MKKLVVTAVVFFAALSATAATKTWTGVAGPLWSNPANWVGGVPVAGDDLVFPGAAASLANTNDLAADLELHNITISGSGYNISGNRIRTTAGIAITGDAVVIQAPLRFDNSQTVSGNEPYSAASSPVLQGNLLLNSGVTFRAVRVTGTLTGDFNATAVTNQSVLTGPIGTLLSIVNGTFVGGTQTAAFSTTVGPGSILRGNGQVGNVVVFGQVGVSLGEIHPGGDGTPYNDTPGILTTGNLVVQNSSSRFRFQLGAAASDRLNVNGTVSLNDASLLTDLGNSNFVPANGQQFVIIANDGSDAVQGRFAGLGEGEKFPAVFGEGSVLLRINYSGGDGNDVVLTAEVASAGTTRVWTGAVNGLWSNAGNWQNGLKSSGGFQTLLGWGMHPADIPLTKAPRP